MAEDIVTDSVNGSKASANWLQVTRDWTKSDPLAAALLLFAGRDRCSPRQRGPARAGLEGAERAGAARPGRGEGAA